MKKLYAIGTGILATVTSALNSPTAGALTGGIRGGIEAARGIDMPTDLLGDGGIFETAVNLLLFLVGAIAVVMIIVGGFRYVISGGDSSAVTAAKNTILYAIIGLIIAALAYAIIDFVMNTLIYGNTATGL